MKLKSEIPAAQIYQLTSINEGNPLVVLMPRSLNYLLEVIYTNRYRDITERKLYDNNLKKKNRIGLKFTTTEIRNRLCDCEGLKYNGPPLQCINGLKFGFLYYVNRLKRCSYQFRTQKSTSTTIHLYPLQRE